MNLAIVNHSVVNLFIVNLFIGMAGLDMHVDAGAMGRKREGPDMSGYAFDTDTEGDAISAGVASETDPLQKLFLQFQRNENATKKSGKVL